MKLHSNKPSFLHITLAVLSGYFLSLSINATAAGPAAESTTGDESTELVTSPLTDPTRPNWYKQATKKKKSPPMVLNSLVNGPQRRIAVISGELMREGDNHRGFTLEQILEDRVLMTNKDDRRLVLQLSSNNFPNKTPRGTNR